MRIQDRKMIAAEGVRAVRSQGQSLTDRVDISGEALVGVEPDFSQTISPGAQPLLKNGLVVGTVAVLLLEHLILRQTNPGPG